MSFKLTDFITVSNTGVTTFGSDGVLINRTGADSYLFFQNSGTNRGAIYGGDPSGNAGLRFYIANNSDPSIVLTSVGNVGIGTTSPTNLSSQTSLTIQGASVSRLDLLGASGAGGGVVFGTATAFTVQGNYGIPLVLDAGDTADMNFNIGGSTKLTIASGGDATFTGLINANQGVAVVDTTAGSAGTPQFKTLLSYQYSNVNALSTIKGGNEASGTNGTYLKFYVNSKDAVNTPLNLLTLQSSFVNGTNATFDGAVISKDLSVIDSYNNDPLIKLAANTSGNVEVQIRTATTSYNPGIGVVTSGYNFNIFTENTPRLTISSGGEATFKATTPSPVVSTPIVSIADSVNGVLGGIGALASGGYPLQIWGGTLELKTGSSGDITAATTRLTISTGGGVFIPGFANPTTSYLSFRNSFSPNVSGGLGFMAIDHSGGNSDGLGIYGHDGVTISTAQTPRLVISSGGVVIVGSQPVPSWISGRDIIQLGDRGSINAINSSGNIYLSNNVYVLANGNNASVKAGGASQIRLSDNEILFYTSNVASAANEVITLTPKLTISSGGDAQFQSLKGSGESLNVKILDSNTNYAQGTGGGLLFQGIFQNNGNIAGGGAIQISKVNSTNGDYSYDMDFYTRPLGSALAKRLTITSGGNVGIDETNPQAKLHVTETTSNSYGEIRIEGQNRGGKLQMYNAAYPVSSINTDQSGNIDFQTSGAFASTTLSTKLSISTGGDATFSGRVIASNDAAGIPTISALNSNTTDDAGVSNLVFSGNALRLGVSSNNSSYGCIASSGANSGLTFVTHDGSWIERIRITSGGTLQVYGTATANALNIDHSSSNDVLISIPFQSTNQDFIIRNSSAGVNLDYAATSWVSASDENIKENITSLDNVLDKIKNIRCVNYNLKDEEIYKKRLGFIAQDFQENFEEVTSINNDDVLGLRYTETIPILMKAIQEQQAQIEELKSEIQLLKNN